MSDAIITYKGQTIHLRNASGPYMTKELDMRSFTLDQIEETARMGDAIIKKYQDGIVKAFMNEHPNGGTFYFLPDGTLGFADAPAFQSGVVVTVTPRQIGKVGAPNGGLASKLGKSADSASIPSKSPSNSPDSPLKSGKIQARSA